jgi:hypothetical protein
MINGDIAFFIVDDSYWSINYRKLRPETNFTTRGLKHLLIRRKKFGEVIIHSKSFGLANQK